MSYPRDQADPHISRVGERREQINHPRHYGGDTVYEVIKVLEARLTHDQFIGFLRGNAIKYLMRSEQKGGIEDLRKAEWYTQYEIDYIRRYETGTIGEQRARLVDPTERKRGEDHADD